MIKALDELISEKGLPKRLVSDRGSCFTSKDFTNYCSKNGIHHILTTVRHPQANGQVERVNATVVPVIMAAMDKQSSWDKQIRMVERWLNFGQNKETGKSAYELVMGNVPNFVDGPLRNFVEEVTCPEYVGPEQ